MSDNPETQYYQSVVDDLRVATERAHEKIAELNKERDLLRDIKFTAEMLLQSLNEESILDEGYLILELGKKLKAYQQFVKEHS